MKVACPICGKKITRHCYKDGVYYAAHKAFKNVVCPASGEFVKHVRRYRQELGVDFDYLKIKEESCKH